MANPTDREAREAISLLAEQGAAERRKEGTIISIDGRFVGVVLDGEGTSLVIAYRGYYEPALGAGVTIERIPATNKWKVVGVRDSAINYVDHHPYDFERPGEAIYYPVPLEAINNWSYNLGTGLEITVYNAFAINSSQDVQYQDETTIDLLSHVDATNERYVVIYMDDTTGTLAVYDGLAEANPSWLEAVNDMMTYQYGVPGLVINLSAAMTEWGSAWRALKRGYLFGTKKIIRLPFSHASGGSGTGSVMTGATASVDGTEGLVPQPVAGDDDKFLRGDATWQDIFYQTIYGPSGTPVTQQPGLQFNTGSHIIPTMGSSGGRTLVTFSLIASAVKALVNYQLLKKAGTPSAEEHSINFLDSNNALVTLSDDAVNSATNVKISVAQPPVLNGGRLSLSSTLPVPLSDITAAGTLYYLPHENALISLWDSVNSEYKIVNFSGGTVSLALPTAGAVVLYDVFGYLNSGALALETLVWASSGYGTSARATALTWQNGLLCKSGDPTRRYLGTIAINGSGQSNDSLKNRELWNMFNRVSRPLSVKEATASWSYGTGAWRATNNNTGNRVYVVSGLGGNPVDLQMIQTFSATSGSAYIGISKNAANPTNYSLASAISGAYVTLLSAYGENTVLGYNHFTSYEYAIGTLTFYGNNDTHILLGTVMT